MPVKYPEGTVSESGKYVVRGGQWVPVDTPSEPEGSAFGRFASGLWETTGKPITEIIPQLVKNAPELMPGIRLEQGEDGVSVRPTAGAQMGIDLAKGTYEAQKEQLAQALESDSGVSERAGHLLAGLLPFIGPAAADAGERMAEGDVAGGIGEGVGLALPFVRPLEGAARATRPLLQSSGAKNVARALKTPAGLADRVMDRAEVISGELGKGTLGTLTKRATKKLGPAKDALESFKVESGNRIVPSERFREVQRAVMESANPINVPEKASAVKKPNWVEEANAARRAKSKTLTKTREADKVPGSLYREELAAAKRVTGDLEDLIDAFEQSGKSGIPASEAFKMRSQLGRKASEGGYYTKLEGQQVSVGARSSGIGQAEFTKQLKESIPGLAEKDLKYSDLRLASQLLENAAAKGAVSGAPAFEILAGRGGLGAALGLASGGIAGSALGPLGVLGGLGVGGALGYGGYAVAREIMNSTLWNSLSAKGKFALARQLGQGGLATGTAVGSAAGRALEQELEQ